MKSVQNCNNVIIVVVVDVIVVVRDVFDLMVVVIIFQISLTTKKFEAKMDFIKKKLAQNDVDTIKCWLKKLRFKQSFGLQIILVTKKGLPKKFRQNQVSNS